ncbi:peptidylprolyl isomerase [Fusibacter sp. A1]|nr:peptidylprolyl isomerase [Fusibacter sp. A1]RXV63777.1 peptidylprolyl isomerase [Fusibacter sp. A1]
MAWYMISPLFESEEPVAVETPDVDGSENPVIPEGDKPLVTITMADGKTMTLELYPSIAPNTVANFVELAESGYYDGLIFHRIIKGFMIQGGDPDGTGMGGPGYGIKGEFTKNGFENKLSHLPGVISMARSQMPDSAGSQFFIVHEDASFLDGDYAAFGKVIEGMDVVEVLANVATEKPSDRPLEEQVMASVKVDRNGYELPEVIKIN